MEAVLFATNNWIIVAFRYVNRRSIKFYLARLRPWRSTEMTQGVFFFFFTLTWLRQIFTAPGFEWPLRRKKIKFFKASSSVLGKLGESPPGADGHERPPPWSAGAAQLPPLALAQNRRQELEPGTSGRELTAVAFEPLTPIVGGGWGLCCRCRRTERRGGGEDT